MLARDAICLESNDDITLGLRTYLAFEQTTFDPRPSSCFLSLYQGGEHPRVGVVSGEYVGHCDTDLDRSGSKALEVNGMLAYLDWFPFLLPSDVH